VRAKACGMMDPDQNYVGVLALVGLVVLVAVLNVWAYRDFKKRKMTRKEAMDEIRDDPHSWWP
jgi:hypothetical protein